MRAAVAVAMVPFALVTLAAATSAAAEADAVAAATINARGLRSYPRIASRALSPPAVQGWPHNTPTDRRAQARKE